MKIAADIMATIKVPAGVAVQTTMDGLRITGPGSHPVVIAFALLDFGDLDDVTEFCDRVAIQVERAGGEA
jgi:hypothetical protein